MKNKVLVKDLYRNTNNYTNQTVTVSGWVRTIRDSKSFGFIELNDGSFFKNVQVVFDTCLNNFDDVKKLSISSSIVVSGEVVKTENNIFETISTIFCKTSEGFSNLSCSSDISSSSNV